MIDIPHPIPVGSHLAPVSRPRWCVTLGVAATLLAALAVALAGCTPQQKAELAHLEVVVAADADTLANDVIGLAAAYQVFAASNPAVAAKIQQQLADATAKLATKAGVSAADVAALKSDITSPGAAVTVIQAATNVKATVASLAPAPAK